MALQGTKALEKWCQIVTEGYENVRILNMSTSWRNGLGFCAIIHHFRPDLIDFDSLDPDDTLQNNQLAFEVAEQHLGIPALLDPQDMVECELLDRLSILTYLSQFFQVFHGATTAHIQKPKRTGSARSSEANSPSKSPLKSSVPVIGRRNEPCKICSSPVFILERLNVGGRLLHRTCFKCARCSTQLNVLNYYETENGKYCCDMCPDEEVSRAEVVEANKKIVADHLDSDTDESSDNEEGEKELNFSKKDEEEKKDECDSTPLPKEEEKDLKKDVEDDEQEVKVEQLDVPVISTDDKVDEQEEMKVELETKQETPVEPCIEEKENSIAEKTESPAEETDGGEEEEKVITEDSNNDQQDERERKESYPDQMNPFEDEDDEEDHRSLSPSGKKALNDAQNTKVKKESTNPFGSDYDDSEEEEDSKSEETKILSAGGTPLTGPPKPPRISLNPFGSDFEDDDEDVSKLNSSSSSYVTPPSPSASSAGTVRSRKKRPAPKPPASTNPTPSPRSKHQNKLQPVPAPRSHAKSPTRPAPPRPASPSLSVSSAGSAARPTPPRPPPPTDFPKQQKDRDNQKRRSQQLFDAASGSETSSVISTSQSSLVTANSAIQLTPLSPDKAIEGQWKKKKGPAPPRYASLRIFDPKIFFFFQPQHSRGYDQLCSYSNVNEGLLHVDTKWNYEIFVHNLVKIL